MESSKIAKFIELSGKKCAEEFYAGSAEDRKLGAQLLLSEVLEYVIKGLGVTPVVGETEIKDPNALNYTINNPEVDEEQMLDGLADVAYTMYWNSRFFGLPLEEAFELVADNNLEKFIKLPASSLTPGTYEPQALVGHGAEWASEVVTVKVVLIGEVLYAVGKDASGKVRKPLGYQSVDLSALLQTIR